MRYLFIFTILIISSEIFCQFTATINYMGARIREAPSINSSIIAEISEGDTITLTGWYEKPFFQCTLDDYSEGYISYASLIREDKVQDIIDHHSQIENPKLFRLTKKYGGINAKKIMKNQYWIGMTDSMARESLGRPNDINKSTGSWGVHEQWVYDTKDLYLYFENGKLTSFQN